MFNNPNKQKANKMETARQHPAINMVSQGTQLNGKLTTQNDIRISGKVDGEVRADGKVILTNEGFIKGDIYASEADIAGKVDGEIIISKKLILRQTAIVTGDVNTNKFLVEEGAVFEGACKMTDRSNYKMPKNGVKDTVKKKKVEVPKKEMIS